MAKAGVLLTATWLVHRGLQLSYCNYLEQKKLHAEHSTYFER